MTQRRHWAHIRIGACALLLPPLTLGAALYSMLTAPDEGAARAPVAVAGAQAVQPELLRGAIQPSDTNPQPVARVAQPVADEPAPRRPAAGARHAAVAGSVEDAARVSDPVPAQVVVPVQVVGPSARANPPPPANMGGTAPTGSPGTEPSQSAPAEVSTALLPRVLYPSSQALPQIVPPRTPTAQMPAAEVPAAQVPLAPDPRSADGPPAASRPPRHSNLANRSETGAVRRSAQAQRQHEFSLKNWLQQIGILPRSTRG
jgi:hypothetical protein